MTLRPLAAGDLDELVDLQAEASVAGFGHLYPQETHPFPHDWVRARWERELADPEVAAYAVLDDAGRLAGFAASRRGELLHFGTAVATWGSGLAGRAHDDLLARMRAGGVDRPWLRVLEGNGRGRRFYEKHGWRPTGETSRSPSPPYPALLTYRLDPDA